MLFNSYIFIFAFLPTAFAIYFILNHYKKIQAAKIFLIGVSLFFYGWWNIYYLPLILVSIFVNYSVSSMMYEEKAYFSISKKMWFLLGLLFNIFLLGYFKYMDFFIENTNHLFHTHISLMHLILPLGISFFTLQQIAFLVDNYEKLVKKQTFIDYMLFVTFFPQLIAGPIVHHKQMMPQFASLRGKVLHYKYIFAGLIIFTIGLFKKVVIADSFSVWANLGFEHVSSLSFFESWATSLSYTFQIYFDFSGYTDMAIGIALLFNIKLPQNFNSPYQATDIIEFWKRWHITLTKFITAYIYTPMTRLLKKPTFNKVMLITLITFLISGFWHGSGWTYIFWGFLHGIAIVINHYWKRTKIKIHPFLAWLLTFNFINASLVFFRAKTWEDGFHIIKSMFDFDGIVLTERFVYIYHHTLERLSMFMPVLRASKTDNFLFDVQTFTWILIAFYIVLKLKNSNEIIAYDKNMMMDIPSYKVMGYAILFIITILYMSVHPYSEFIYFNF